MNREMWLEQRRTGIGSSDAAALVGLSPWATPLHVYADKVYGAQKPQTAPMRWGLMLEDAIATAYQEQTGAMVEPGSFLRSELYPWMIATPDRYAHHPNAEPRIVELKTCNAFAADEWGEPGTDEIPAHYLIQVQHQMLVAAIPVTDVAVLIGGSDFRVYTVRLSETVCEGLVSVEAAFWERVKSQRPPEPDWSHSATVDLLGSLYKPDPDLCVTLPPEAVALADSYEAARHEAARADEMKSVAKAKLLGLLGTAGVGTLEDGRRITRSEIVRKSYTVAESTYTDFRIRQPRGVKK